MTVCLLFWGLFKALQLVRAARELTHEVATIHALSVLARPIVKPMSAHVTTQSTRFPCQAMVTSRHEL